MYNKRIICDIDDTISITKNRDFNNAEPVLPVINKLNYLYDSGWEIFLVTARGQLSCKGDSKKASDKYGAQIKEWLKNNNVKYHSLSFKKQLATYYVDDKGLSVNDFINLNIRKLETGWSGADVELRNGKVYKTHKDSLLASKWYEIAKRFFNVPKVYSLIGETLCMEYIDNNSPMKLQEIINIIKDFKHIRVNDDKQFETYIERIKFHCAHNNRFFEVVNILENLPLKLLHLTSSFCHGDFSYENILVNNGDHYLIDPIYKPDIYSSYLLDVSKLLHSFRKHGMAVEYNFLFDSFKGEINYKILFALEASQWVRVYKYAPDNEKNIIEENINYLINGYFKKDRIFT